jgi:hypothetical protein
MELGLLRLRNTDTERDYQHEYWSGSRFGGDWLPHHCQCGVGNRRRSGR